MKTRRGREEEVVVERQEEKESGDEEEESEYKRGERNGMGDEWRTKQRRNAGK